MLVAVQKTIVFLGTDDKSKNTQDKSQWIVTERVLSSLTISGIKQIVHQRFITFINRRKLETLKHLAAGKDIYATGHLYSVSCSYEAAVDNIASPAWNLI